MVEHGNHFDSFVNNPKVDPQNTLQLLMPYVHQAFDALVNWVENGVPAPPSMTIGVPESKNKVFSIWDHSEIDMY